jgi:GT2 family glycosyltransferase
MKLGIIVVSFNHFLFTKFCIESIVKYTDSSKYKLCLVDNGSIDETKEWASSLVSDGTLNKFISNDYNAGACRASNQGTLWALNEKDLTHIAVMANDHIVTLDWITPLFNSPFDCTCPFVFHSVKEIRAMYPKIGEVVDRYKPLRLRYLQEDNEEYMNYVLYQTYGDMSSFVDEFKADNYTNPYIQSDFVLWPGLITYKRDVIESVGLKDEEYLKFDLASYSDIDHYVRVYLAGFTSGVAMTSYVHHWGSITTRKLGLKQEKISGYVNNERGAYDLFVKKWQCDPHNLASIIDRRSFNGK